MKKFYKFLWVAYGIILGAIFCGFWAQNVMAEAVNDIISDIYIKAINPGYMVDGQSNVGEMIEIARHGNSDELISLAGVAVRYTNSSRNKTVLVEFPENSFIAGETILLRLASSTDHELAAVNYTKTLAFKGKLELVLGEEVLDLVCWTGEDGCIEPFKSSKPTALVRSEDGFTHTEDYKPKYEENSYIVDDDGKGEVASQCKGLIFSEVLSYYAESQDEQFVEFYNTNAEQILLDGCFLRYKNKDYKLSGILRPEEYHARWLKDFGITKNPNNNGILELVDSTGEILDVLIYPNGQRKGTSYAFIGYDDKGEEIWHTTYAVTPGKANNYQEFKTCEAGKVVNEQTGNCVKVTEVIEKVCPAGTVLNILTGRCKKVETEIGKIQCKDGYEINPETGRCRKIKENTGASYALTPENYKEDTSFVALYAVLGVIGVGIVYVIYEFRGEIRKFFGKVFR